MKNVRGLSCLITLIENNNETSVFPVSGQRDRENGTLTKVKMFHFMRWKNATNDGVLTKPSISGNLATLAIYKRIPSRPNKRNLITMCQK